MTAETAGGGSGHAERGGVVGLGGEVSLVDDHEAPEPEWLAGWTLARDGEVTEPVEPTTSELGARIRWAVEERLGVTQAEAARRLGVKRPQLSRWIHQPGRPPNEASLRRIAELTGVSAAWLRYGVGEPDGAEEEGGRGADELTAEDLFRHFEGVVRRMGGAEVAPHELKLRKQDVVEGLKRLYGAQGGIPGWVYALEGRIARDEI